MMNCTYQWHRFYTAKYFDRDDVLVHRLNAKTHTCTQTQTNKFNVRFACNLLHIYVVYIHVYIHRIAWHHMASHGIAWHRMASLIKFMHGLTAWGLILHNHCLKGLRMAIIQRKLLPATSKLFKFQNRELGWPTIPPITLTQFDGENSRSISMSRQ